ncbi:MAG: alginate export family protein [Planctomycetes bacterium]|nr:alginate export family protein [Planctomycetota bacterium]
MTRFLTVLALIVCVGGLAAAAEPDLTITDPWAQFWRNNVQFPLQGWGNLDTTWGQMMESVELHGHLRVRYESSEIMSIQRIFGPSPTGPDQTLVPDMRRLGMVGDSWDDWVAYKALLNVTFNLAHDISFYTSFVNMNVLGDNTRFHRTMPTNVGGSTRIDSPQIHNPEVAVYQSHMQWEDFLLPGITAKAGRQELVFGDEWLLSNNSFYGGLSYDAVKLSINTDDMYSIDLFAAWVSEMYSPPGPSRPKIFGVYLTYIVDQGLEENQETLLDLYLLYNVDNMTAAADLGSRTDFAKERRYTLGSRLAGNLLPDVDYSLQAACQAGHTATNTTSHADVEAYAGEAEIGKTWKEMDWSPRIGVRAAYASGDGNTSDGDSGAFNPLYQDMHGKHGLADVFHFTNLIDYAATLTMTPGKNWTIGVEGHTFRLAERIQGSSKQLGRELDVFARLQATERLSAELVWTSFDQGQAFTDVTGTDPHSQRIYLNFEYSF